MTPADLERLDQDTSENEVNQLDAFVALSIECMVRVRRTGRGMGLRIGRFTRMLST